MFCSLRKIGTSLVRQAFLRKASSHLFLLYIGKRGHPEPEGVLGEVPGQIFLVENKADVSGVQDYAWLRLFYSQQEEPGSEQVDQVLSILERTHSREYCQHFLTEHRAMRSDGRPLRLFLWHKKLLPILGH